MLKIAQRKKEVVSSFKRMRSMVDRCNERDEDWGTIVKEVGEGEEGRREREREREK
jgi:hypothetical protein